MNSAGKHAVVALLVISIAGCADKKTRIAQPAQSLAPPADAGKAGAMYPPPLTQTEPQPEEPATSAPVVASTDTPAPPPPEPPQKKPASNHKPKPAASKPATPPGSTPAEGNDATAAAPSESAPAQTNSATEMATAGEPAASSPIGQLSTAGTTDPAQTREKASDLITSTENGLNGIKRTLNSQEQETAGEIKTFLLKARKALANDDVDGATTLATKARVLLDELTKD